MAVAMLGDPAVVLSYATGLTSKNLFAGQAYSQITCLGQHLQAQDLPLSIPAIYTAADGSPWPGLIVDGVYDLGQHYRVDLLICSEAAVARLKAREVSKLDGYTASGAIVQDEDFD